MADTSIELPRPSEVTEVRFSTKAILIAMAVIAICASALGAFIRQFPADVQWKLGVFWAVLVVLLAGVTAFLARRRYVAEKRAGRTLYYLEPHSYFLPKAPRAASFIFGGFMLSAAPTCWVFESFRFADRGKDAYGGIDGMEVYALAISAVGITYIWWNRKIRVSENGVLVRNRFYLWSDFTRWYWDACNPGVAVLEFMKQGSAPGGAAGKVVPSERDGVTQLLVEKRAAVKAAMQPAGKADPRRRMC